MSREQENVQLVKQYFALIGQGNLRAAIEMLAEDVDFQSPVTQTVTKEISWARPRHRREEVIAFFQEFLHKVALEQISLFEFTAQDDRVVVEGKNRCRVKATDRTYENDWVTVFTIHGGKITRYRHYYDTADILAAFG